MLCRLQLSNELLNVGELIGFHGGAEEEDCRSMDGHPSALVGFSLFYQTWSSVDGKQVSLLTRVCCCNTRL